MYNYLWFKTASEVEYSSKFDKVELTSEATIFPYTYDSKKVVYRGDGYNYTGTISGDTLRVTGTADILIYIKVK